MTIKKPDYRQANNGDRVVFKTRVERIVENQLQLALDALFFYGNKKNYGHNVRLDNGNVARKAIKEIEALND